MSNASASMRDLIDLLNGVTPQGPIASTAPSGNFLTLLEGRRPPAPIAEAAGLSRIVGHLVKGRPFLQLTGARRGLTQKAIRARNREIIMTLRKLGLGAINTVGTFDEMDPATQERIPVREESLFVPLARHAKLDTDTLLELGTELGKRFEQDAIIYGDGARIFNVDFVNNDIDHIGDYDAIDTHDMPYGSAAVKADSKSPGQKWAWAYGKRDSNLTSPSP